MAREVDEGRIPIDEAAVAKFVDECTQSAIEIVMIVFRALMLALHHTSSSTASISCESSIARRRSCGDASFAIASHLAYWFFAVVLLLSTADLCR
jgi:hypothetical protein